ncbi:presenilin [Skeletonema marinoi]|uniref:Presenilin n=1 Tax=Skeletonema marinoi TaxID=267567 RepID=A0AAD8YLG9_9STRA|nr:presenilin [Skeletonema marinoi]
MTQQQQQQRPQLANMIDPIMEASISHLDPRLPSLHHAQHHQTTNEEQTTNTVDFRHNDYRSTIAGDSSAVATSAAVAAVTSSDEENQPVDLPNSNNDTTTATTAEGISLEELIYATSSFHAIVQPVSITMILTALSVHYINTPATKAAGEAQLAQTYQVFTISEDTSAMASLGLGLANSLIIVCVIGGMTFLLVILYKYRCMKVLGGYMVIASTVLLGFLGGQMFHVAMYKYQWMVDQLSYYVTMYNFAVVGTVAIFYQRGIPQVINQAYLVFTSVIVAWQLSYFNDWMAWALLVMLALYDLFAVLTPCGPLKALVKLMSKDDAPAMPGLLYEARLPDNATRPGQASRRNNNVAFDAAAANRTNNRSERSSRGRNDANASPTSVADGIRERNTDSVTIERAPQQSEAVKSKSSSQQVQVAIAQRQSTSTSSAANTHMASEEAVRTSVSTSSHSRTAIIPLAIARVYKLPLVIRNSALHTITSLDTSSPTSYLQQQFSPQELQQNVEVKFPRGGGRIESTSNDDDDEIRYVVYNKDGELRRTLVVNESGKVLEVLKSAAKSVGDNNIKLGLGDFIFYSVLVSKAAENSFAAFVACFISILMGLGGTLVLLAVYHKALPALPISIFLAVVFFVLTIYCMSPWIEAVWQAPFYV